MARDQRARSHVVPIACHVHFASLAPAACANVGGHGCFRWWIDPGQGGVVSLVVFSDIDREAKWHEDSTRAPAIHETTIGSGRMPVEDRHRRQSLRGASAGRTPCAIGGTRPGPPSISGSVPILLRCTIRDGAPRNPNAGTGASTIVSPMSNPACSVRYRSRLIPGAVFSIAESCVLRSIKLGMSFSGPKLRCRLQFEREAV